MDPNANLAELLELARHLVDFVGDEGEEQHPQVVRLCELVLALDEWIGEGGSLPDRWLA